MKKIISLCIFIPLLCAGACLLYCNTADPKLVAYYRDESNYIQVVGEVTEIYDDPKYGITFALSNMNAKLDDICFRIRGKNADIVRKNDYENKIAVGDTITIMTCPGYFYDGYEYPVVALSVDDVDLLLFDDGFPNWNEFYVKNRKR